MRGAGRRVGRIVGPAAGLTLACEPALAAGAAPAAGGSAGDAVLALVTLLPLIAAAGVLGVLWRRDVIRPGSFSRRGVRDAAPLPWWHLTLSALVVVLSTAIGGAAAMSVWAAARGGGTPDGRWADAAQADPALAAVATLSGFALACVVGVWLARRYRALAPAAGLGPGITWRGVALGLGCFALALPVVMAVNRLAARAFTALTDAQPEAVAHDTLRAIVDEPGSPWTWGLIVAVVVGAPVAEELAFRGFLQTGILRATGRAWTAILISSAVFTLVHGLAPYAMATIFVLSVCLGVAYERTRSLAVPIVMHAAFNAGNVLLAVVLHR